MFRVLLIVVMFLPFVVKSQNYIYSCEYSDRQTEVQALACNIFFESANANEGITGMHGVAFNTLNRVKSGRFPNTVQGVVYQQSQYSWYSDGESDRIMDTHYDRLYWEISLIIAKDVLAIKEEDYRFYDITKGSLFYHNQKVEPYWADEKYKTVRINNHTFYWNDKKS